MENKIKSLLCKLEICNQESIAPFFPKVRDRDDISVLKCNKSGVIFLSRSDHMDMSHYEEMEGFSYWGSEERNRAITACFEDNHRRFAQFREIIANKRWLDIGTGAGGILELLSTFASKTYAVEPQKTARQSLIESGYEVFSSISEVPVDNTDVVTLFHVFEHFSDPLGSLELLKEKMNLGAKVIIEVPHANDFLISFFDSDHFKAFTFWSEHLILHTRHSLNQLLEKAGYKNITIEGFQRYPLANHLYWLSNGKPGGHIQWSQLRTSDLDTAYMNMLRSLDKTDTLIAIAEV
ncbi:MAG: class I SAM-dependent methyltransferase [Candidatus Brocadiaceae bacterium]|nr:class I SAM-dependent methyltransferase [Candidatus Brocadiaceae bacterium]